MKNFAHKTWVSKFLKKR